MRWGAYFLGIVAGAAFGYWLHGFWEQLEGVGAGVPPSFDAIVPLVLFVVTAGAVAFAGRRPPPD